MTGTPHYPTEGESIVLAFAAWAHVTLARDGVAFSPHCHEADAAQFRHLIDRAERWLEAQEVSGD